MKSTVYMAAGHVDHVDASQKENALERNEESDEINNLNVSYVNEEVDSEYKKPEVDSFMSEKEYIKRTDELSDLLVSVCDFSHDECARLLTAMAKSKSVKERSVKTNEKSVSNGYPSMFDKVDAKQIYSLSRIIEYFTSECEKVCSKSSTSLKAAFQLQASKFMNKFHNDRKEKLNLILEKECWRPAEVQSNFQTFVDDLITTKSISRYNFDSAAVGKCESFLNVNNEKFIIVG